jgi:hypothetical protein
MSGLGNENINFVLYTVVVRSRKHKLLCQLINLSQVWHLLLSLFVCLSVCMHLHVTQSFVRHYFWSWSQKPWSDNNIILLKNNLLHWSNSEFFRFEYAGLISEVKHICVLHNYQWLRNYYYYYYYYLFIFQIFQF